MSWKEAQSRIPWGTAIIFGIGISLGIALLSTQAGIWLAKLLASNLGMPSMSPPMVFAVLALFLIHLGFARPPR